MHNKIIILLLLFLLSSQAIAASSMSGGSWSPYVAGFFIGALAWLTFKFSDKPIGASSAYATVAASALFAKLRSERSHHFTQNKRFT